MYGEGSTWSIVEEEEGEIGRCYREEGWCVDEGGGCCGWESCWIEEGCSEDSFGWMGASMMFMMMCLSVFGCEFDVVDAGCFM